MKKLSERERFLLFVSVVIGLVGLGFIIAGFSSGMPLNHQLIAIGTITLTSEALLVIAYTEQRSRKIPKKEKELLPDRTTEDFIIYTITLPQHTPWQPERALQFATQFFNGFQFVTLRIVATHETIQWQIVDMAMHDIGEAMELAIRASYPETSITKHPYEMPQAQSYPFYRRILQYKSGSTLFFAPITYVTDLKHTDPLIAITQTMSSLRPGEQIIYALIVDRFDKEAYTRGRREITVKDFSRRWEGVGGLFTGKNLIGHVANIASTPDEYEKFERDLQKVLEFKLETSLYRSYFSIQIDSPDPNRTADLTVIASQTLLYARERFNAPILTEGNLKDYVIESSAEDLKRSSMGLYLRLSNEKDETTQQLEATLRFTLNPNEIAALWHLPHTEMTAPTIKWLKKEVELPSTLANQARGIVVGTGKYKGKQKRVLMQSQDRAGHMLVLGRIGVGKSTFLHTLIQQDIQAGFGVCVVDPHGDLVRDILRYSIPEARKQDVVVLDFADTLHPPGFNLLTAAKDEERSLTTASRVVEIIEMMYGDMRETPRTRETMESVLATLWLDDKATLFDVPKMFEDKEYRDQILKRGNSRALRQFWEGYHRMGKKLQYELRQPVEHRIRSLYNTPALEVIMGHPHSIELQNLIGQDKIILVSLDVDDKIIPKRGKELLGAIILSAFQLGAIQRSSDKPFYVYIDEAHRFVTSSLSDLFVEVRKRGIVLTLATQYLKQLKGKTLEAIEGTVGTIVAFSVGDDDAKDLPMMRPQFDPTDLVKLDKFEAAAWMKQGGVTLPAFSMKTLAPNFINDMDIAIEQEKALRAFSQQKYASMSREDVLKWLDGQYSADDNIDQDEQDDEDNDLLDPNPEDDPEGDDDK